MVSSHSRFECRHLHHDCVTRLRSHSGALAQATLSASEAHRLWKLPKELPVVGRYGAIGLGFGEGNEFSLLALVELTQQIRHGFELLHSDVMIKDVVRGQFQECGGLDHRPHEDLFHPRTVRRSALSNTRAADRHEPGAVLNGVRWP